MNFLNLENKTFLISGVANKKSVATFIAKELMANGASCIFTAQNTKNLEQVNKHFEGSKSFVVNVESQDEINSFANELKAQGIKLDGFVHSIAYADFSDMAAYHETRIEHMLQAANISCFSFTTMSNAIKDQLNENASCITISISNTKATNYGYLGPIKAALETSCCYLAKSFSEFSNIRFNAIGAGPLKTSASAGIPNYIENYVYAENLTLRKKALQTKEVANTAAFLLSERASGINAQTIVIDAGMSSNYFDKKSVDAFAKENL